METTKICSKCKRELPFDKFGKQKGRKFGLKSQCKECISNHDKIYYKENKKKISESSKQYYEDNKEKVTKRHNIYYGNNKEKISESEKQYRDKNKEKVRMHNKNYNIENKDKIREYHKVYNKNNKEKISESEKQYRRKNKIKMSKYQKEYYLINREHKIEQQNKYYKENPEIKRKWRRENRDKINIIGERRRSREKNLPSTFTEEQWKETKIYFNNTCAYCGKELPLAQEHIIPVVKGGGYIKENIIPSCKSCNSSKYNKNFEEWYPIYKYYTKEREDKIFAYIDENTNNNIEKYN